MRSLAVLLVGFVVLGPGCAGGGGDGTDPDGGNGNGDGGGGDGGGSNTGYCAESTKLVYTIEENKRISKFDPETGEFLSPPLGYLECPGSSTFFRPFGMSLGRDGNAYVLYRDYSQPNLDPKLFHVNMATLQCTETSWTPHNGIKVFVMAYSTDTAGGFDDRLFLAGANDVDDTSLTFATLETATMQSTVLGTIAGWSELSGNSDAELWSYVATASPPRIDKLDKTNGSVLETTSLPTLMGNAVLWSFVTWGGDFWVFLKRDNEPATKIHHFNGTTGALIETIDTNSVGIPRQIVGAAVSTCAPVVLL